MIHCVWILWKFDDGERWSTLEVRNALKGVCHSKGAPSSLEHMAASFKPGVTFLRCPRLIRTKESYACWACLVLAVYLLLKLLFAFLAT